MIISYTSYDTIRAVLGVSAKELPDTVLELDIYWDKLYLRMAGINEAWEEDFIAASALSTVAALKFTATLKTFVAHFVAKECLSAMPQFSLKSLQAGKNAFTRSGDTALLTAISRIGADYARYEMELLNAYSIYKETGSVSSIMPSFLGVSNPSTDLVTGS